MLFEDLSQRGLIYQQTSEKMPEILAKPQTFYCGADPTSDSLHIGSLLPLVTMRRMQLAGHKPILLLGGATGMIGDPSGKSAERNLLTREQIEINTAGIQKVTEKLIDYSGSNAAVLVNNYDWMKDYSYIDFLREIGKHFSVNAMMAKDSVKTRIESRDQGISYTEFSYMLLQAYDFYYLYKNQGCTMQIGGSDQWGNITEGVDLVRRMQGESHNKDEVYGFTFPLVTKSDGSKFGKTEQGNIWLDGKKTSPYQFYQYLVRLADADVVNMLKYYSMKPFSEVEELVEKSKTAPEKREAQTALARELTELIHGADELKRVEHASQALFAGNLQELDKNTLLEAFSEAPSVELAKTELEQMTLVDLLVKSQLCPSKGQARKDLKAGAIYINNARVENGEEVQGKDVPLLFGSVAVLRRGKKNYCLALFK